jgi:hypothetical protein
VTTPHNFTIGGATVFRPNDSNAAAKWQIRTYYRHTARLTDVHGHAVRPARDVAILPFDEKAEAGDGPLVGTKPGPALFQLVHRWGQRAHSF